MSEDYKKINDDNSDEETPQLPEDPEKKIESKSRGLDYFLERPKESKNDLHVYFYHIKDNRFKPYKMAKVKKNENFPQAEIDKLISQLEEQGRPPRMDRISLVLGICIFLTISFCLVVAVLERLGHSKVLTVLLWTIALVPCGITSLMCMVYCMGLWSVYGRRNSLNTLTELRNREIFNPMGINVVFSQNFEWFCVEIHNKKLLAKQEFKIGGKKKNKNDGGLMDQIDDDFDF